ncbi:MAG: ATP synthase F1 subunit gamma [Dehalococcoidia bacterium]|nr:ATP synthase F1 subunit gamma [Dehalococcoidia bacterium]
MPNIRQIRRRIRSVQNTAKITNAMSMIAASKMRRAQQRGIQGRPYAEQIRGVMSNLMAVVARSEALHPLLQQRPVLRVGYIHITADRGLCGALNSNMNRSGFHFINGQPAEVSVIAVGRRGRDFMARSGKDLRAVFIELGDSPTLLDTLPISRIVIEDYLSGHFDQVYIGYTDFVNTVVQRPRIERLIPVEPAPLESLYSGEYLYEPSPDAVLNSLLPRYVEMQVYHAILEHLASEQSARMVAMRSASDNARDMIKDLTLTYNKARQEIITKEILDLVGGAAALEG